MLVSYGLSGPTEYPTSDVTASTTPLCVPGWKDHNPAPGRLWNIKSEEYAWGPLMHILSRTQAQHRLPKLNLSIRKCSKTKAIFMLLHSRWGTKSNYLSQQEIQWANKALKIFPFLWDEYNRKKTEAVFRKGPLRKLRGWYLNWHLIIEKGLAKWWEGGRQSNEIKYSLKTLLPELVLCNLRVKEDHEVGELKCWIRGGAMRVGRGEEGRVAWDEHALEKQQMQDHRMLRFINFFIYDFTFYCMSS